MKRFNYKNVMEVPKLEKIVVHVTLGEAVQNIKLLDAAEKQLALITGQKPIITKAKRALAAFKLKKGMPIGCKVTLRRDRMYEFLDRLISLALPRIRDFKGLSPKSFDGRGNYSFGIKEQFIFPEIDYDKVEMIHGLDITICTTAKTDEEALELLKEFGMPYRK
ncbi:MAG: 50S ribosomal protein L5 [Chitinispirillaceae bacterium]|nr:50S ribosomal protein L5 [Chitinispirillaceae bacterium]